MNTRCKSIIGLLSALTILSGCGVTGGGNNEYKAPQTPPTPQIATSIALTDTAVAIELSEGVDTLTYSQQEIEAGVNVTVANIGGVSISLGIGVATPTSNTTQTITEINNGGSPSARTVTPGTTVSGGVQAGMGDVSISLQAVSLDSALKEYSGTTEAPGDRVTVATVGTCFFHDVTEKIGLRVCADYIAGTITGEDALNVNNDSNISVSGGSASIGFSFNLT